MQLKVGELAKRAGLTVRTLHHYDEIGLLTPSGRSERGYRLYNRDDIARLHAIQALRQMGVALQDIAVLLQKNEGTPLAHIVDQQLHALEQQIAQAQTLQKQLKLMQIKLALSGEPDMTAWLDTLELMSAYGRHLDPAELKILTENWNKTASEWEPLVAAVRDARKRGLDIQSQEVQRLGRKWSNLTFRWMGGDLDLLARWQKMYESEPLTQGRDGVDLALIHYIRSAFELRFSALGRHFTMDELSRMQDLEDEWRKFDLEVKTAIKQELSQAKGKALLEKWHALIDKVVGRDADLHKRYMSALKQEPLLRAGSYLDLEVIEYLFNADSANES